MMEVLFIDTNTSGIIQPGTVVAQTEQGLVTNRNQCWKFIPEERLWEERSYSGYYTEEPPASLHLERDQNLALAYSDTVGQQYTEKMEQRFGFRDLFISTKQTAPASVIVSDAIDVSRAASLFVTGTVINPEAGSIEVSVLDNTDEYPILLNQSGSIIKEKLFYGRDLRFIIDLTQPYILYEDNIPVSKDYLSLTSAQFDQHTYALSYQTAEPTTVYIPSSSSIRLKIIVRQYSKDIFITLQDVTVHKTGETISWNSQA